jgi:hypothetical protein
MPPQASHAPRTHAAIAHTRWHGEEIKPRPEERVLGSSRSACLSSSNSGFRVGSGFEVTLWPLCVVPLCGGPAQQRWVCVLGHGPCHVLWGWDARLGRSACVCSAPARHRPCSVLPFVGSISCWRLGKAAHCGSAAGPDDGSLPCDADSGHERQLPPVTVSLCSRLHRLEDVTGPSYSCVLI